MHLTPIGQPNSNPQPASHPLPEAAPQGPKEQFLQGEKPSMLGAARALLHEGSTERWRVRLPFCHRNKPTTNAQGELFMSSEAGRLQKLDPETGKALWKQDDGRFLTDPSFTPEGKVVVVLDFRKIQVRDPATGELAHQVMLDSPSLSPPATGPNDQLVILGGDGITEKDWSIYAVDPKVKPKRNLLSKLLGPISLIPHHGTVHQWEVDVNARKGWLPIPMTPKGEIHRLVNLPGGNIAAVTGEQEVIAIDPRTGQEAWRQELPAKGLYDPVPIGQDRLLLADHQTLYYLDARTGQTLEQRPAGGVLFSQPTADKEGNVFFFTGTDELQVHRHDGRRWSQKGEFETGLPPVQDDQGHLFVVKKGVLSALNAETGEEIYRLTCPGQVSSSPAVLKDGSLVLKVRAGQGLDEELVCLQSPAQAAIREAEEGGPTIATSAAWVRVGGVQVKRRQ